MCVKRCRHTYGYEVHIFHKAEVCSGAEHAVVNDLFQVIVNYISDIIVPGVDHIDLGLLYIEADGLKAGLGFFYCQRKADIAETHHSYGDLFIFYFVKQLFLHLTPLITFLL